MVLPGVILFVWDYTVVAVVLTVRGSYSSLYSVYSHLHPVLSLLLSARGTILKSTLFFLYSFLPEALFSNLPCSLPCSLLLCGCFCIGCLVCSSFMRGNSPIAIPRTHKEQVGSENSICIIRKGWGSLAMGILGSLSCVCLLGVVYLWSVIHCAV